MNPPKTPNFRGFTFSQSVNFYPYFCESKKSPKRPPVGASEVLACNLLFLIEATHQIKAYKPTVLKIELQRRL